jgi:hypothetical protein
MMVFDLVVTSTSRLLVWVSTLISSRYFRTASTEGLDGKLWNLIPTNGEVSAAADLDEILIFVKVAQFESISRRWLVGIPVSTANRRLSLVYSAIARPVTLGTREAPACRFRTRVPV